MSFSADDFKNKYVLGGRRHDPSNNKTIFDQIIRGCFSIVFSDATNTDDGAIIEADDCINQAFQSARVGKHLIATLWFNDRIVKTYPKQIKS